MYKGEKIFLNLIGVIAFKKKLSLFLMSSFFTREEKKIRREIEKEKLLKRLAEIDKEEEDELDEQQE
jgi:uncharacterized membrane protein